MALFHTTVVDNQIKALDTIGTVSGAICTFDTDRAERLVNLEVAITATGGGGTPVSPIAINGFSACNLSVNGTTETISFGQTVYGGRLNVGSGVLTVTHGIINDLGVLSWVKGSRSFYADITGAKNYAQSVIPDMLCEGYNPVSYNDLVSEQYNEVCSINNNFSIILIRDTNYATASDFTTAVTGKKAIYELATPLTIQLDSKQIQSIIGTNNIYADTGDIIDLKFILSVGQAIS